MQDLLPLAEKLGARLKERGETIAIAESSTGGLISAALLSVSGANHKNTDGRMNSVNNVPIAMPATKMMPMLLRASAPAPVTSTSGK